MSEHEPPNEPGNEPRPEQEPSTAHPRIWVGSLADYNAGRLHGQWIDATQSVYDLQWAIARILAAAPTPGAEEWGIFDHDGFAGLRVNEHADLGLVSAIATGIAEHGPAFAAWTEIVDHDLARLHQFDDAYLGVYDSRTDYAEQLLDDLGIPERIEGLPDWLAPYIDINYQALVDDMSISGDITFADHGGKVYIFDGRI